MQKKLFGWTLAFLALPLFMTSCRIPIMDGDPLVPPPAIALLVMVNNQADTEASIKIRHARLLSETGTDWVSAEWSEAVTVEPGKTQRLGNETAHYRYKDKEQEMSGFILWEESTAEQLVNTATGKSSFVLEITLGDRTIRLAGYKTEEPGFDGTELGWLYIKRVDDFPGGRYAELWSQGNGGYITVPYVIPATLTVNANGTYSFEFDEDMHWHTVAVW